MIEKSLVRDLQKIVGKGNVLSSDEQRWCYSYDATPGYRTSPDIVVLPGSIEEVISVQRIAFTSGIPVTPRGAGTDLSGGAVAAHGGIVLALTRMNHIIEIDSRNLTATVESGVVTSVFQSAVESIGLFYPPDPGSASVSTIGGNVATCAGGLRGLKYGVTRDYVLGLDTVLASGDLIHTGGKTVKNVTGYDLTRLLVGSAGTLGIIVNIILKLIPLPKSKRTMLVAYDSLENAAASVSSIISNHILPATLEFIDRTTLQCLLDYQPFDLPREAQAVLLIEVDGSESTVAEEANKIESILKTHHPTSIQMARNAAEQENLTLARRSALAALARIRPTLMLEDMTVPPSQLEALVGGIQQIAQKHQVMIATFGHAGDGNLHPTFLTDENDENEMAKVRQAFGDLVELTLNLGGTLSGEHGIGLAKARFMPRVLSPATLNVMRAIKRVLDPKGILNPGKMFPEEA